MLTEEQKKNIIEKLSSKNVVVHCPMCGNDKFSVVDSFLSNSMSDTPGKLDFSAALPCAAIICINCGFLSQHALGALGLMLKPGGKNE